MVAFLTGSDLDSICPGAVGYSPPDEILCMYAVGVGSCPSPFPVKYSWLGDRATPSLQWPPRSSWSPWSTVGNECARARPLPPRRLL